MPGHGHYGQNRGRGGPPQRGGDPGGGNQNQEQGIQVIARCPQPFSGIEVQVRRGIPRPGRSPKWSDCDASVNKALCGSRPNIGLLYHRYAPCQLDARGANYHIEQNDYSQWLGSGLLKWFVQQANKSGPLSTTLLKRRKRVIQSASPAHKLLKVQTQWRVCAGISNPAPAENTGLFFEWTHGAPMLPGRSVKGVVRHYLEQDPHARENAGVKRLCQPPKQVAQLLFGSDARDGASGCLAVGDGIACKKARDGGWLTVEVLTPHHSRYYGGEQRLALDTDTPVPLHFLAVDKDVTFEIPMFLTSAGIALEKDDSVELLAAAEDIIVTALGRWGVGARTGAGFGVMENTEDSP